MKLLAETCQIFGLENRKKIAKFSKITFTCRSLSYLFYAGCDIIRWYWQIGLNTWLYCFPISDGWIVSRGTDHSYIFLIGWLWSRDTTVFAGSCHSTDHSYTFWLDSSDHVILQFSPLIGWIRSRDIIEKCGRLESEAGSQSSSRLTAYTDASAPTSKSGVSSYK